MRRFVLAVSATLLAAPAFAQSYPDHPIRIIVPTPAGGPVDVMARLVAAALPAKLGQNVVIENKPGAGNIIGSKIAADAPPDGYTLMVSAASGLIMSPMIYANAGYDASSFAPIALIAETPQLLVINAQLPFKTVAELVGYAKANPGKLNYSTGGIGTLPHLAAELFKKTTGTNIVHVPYKGGGPALTGVVAGEAQMTFDPVATSLQLIRSDLPASNSGRLAASTSGNSMISNMPVGSEKATKAYIWSLRPRRSDFLITVPASLARKPARRRSSSMVAKLVTPSRFSAGP